MTNSSLILKTLSIVSCTGLLLSLPAFADSETGVSPLEVPKANFASADTDANGALNIEEFTAFVNANAEVNFGTSKKIRRFKAYQRAHKKIDGDKNGEVSWEELMKAQQ